MKCIVCDRCKQIIEDPKKYRVVLCSRPLKPVKDGAKTCRSDDRQANDIIWEKEVCLSCADEIENYTDVKSDPPKNPDDVDKPGTTEPVDPESPDNPAPEEPDKDPENPEPNPDNSQGTEESGSEDGQ